MLLPSPASRAAQPRNESNVKRNKAGCSSLLVLLCCMVAVAGRRLMMAQLCGKGFQGRLFRRNAVCPCHRTHLRLGEPGLRILLPGGAYSSTHSLASRAWSLDTSSNKFRLSWLLCECEKVRAAVFLKLSNGTLTVGLEKRS